MAINFNHLFKKKEKKVLKNIIPRYLFTSNHLDEEKNLYDSSIKKINEFWQAFIENEENIWKRFKNENQFDVAKFINKHLTPISKHIMWEFGPALNNNNSHRLVLSSESKKEYRPLVEKFIEKAPLLENWEFYTYRPSEDLENAKATVQARTGGNLNDLFFQIYINEYNQIDLFFIRETCKSDQDFNQAFNDVFVALETLIGEEYLDKWIGLIEVDLQKQKDNSEVYPIEKLQDYVVNEIMKMKLTLPTNFYYDRWQDSKWTSFEIAKPKKQENYYSKDDLLFAISMDNKILATTLSNIPFYNERFAEKETFCYIKIDGLGVETESPEKVRAVYEDVLNEVLIQNGLGCTIGGGTGLRYSYIDIALADLEEGIHAIRAALLMKNITKNAWIFFFDLDRKTEWIGIHNNSPRPFLEF